MEKNNKKADAQGAGTQNDNVREIGANLPMVIAKEAEALSLAQTIKAVEDLTKLIKHRDLFEQYRDELKDFSIRHTDSALEEKSNFVNCGLEITDDNGETFEIKSPSVIKAVVEYLANQFDVRLQETEAKIKFPLAQAA
jgi:septin family protein